MAPGGSENNNLPGEYAPLAADVPPSIHFADVALDRSPDAVNFWLGGSASETALHRDGYENLYACVVGEKRFVLLPPVAVPLVREEMVRGARWARPGPQAAPLDSPLEVRLDADGGSIPFPTLDPDKDPLTERAGGLSPMEVVLGPGDLLYLPSLWSAAPLFSFSCPVSSPAHRPPNPQARTMRARSDADELAGTTR